jgi:hypothetical protein
MLHDHSQDDHGRRGEKGPCEEGNLASARGAGAVRQRGVVEGGIFFLGGAVRLVGVSSRRVREQWRSFGVLHSGYPVRKRPSTTQE